MVKWDNIHPPLLPTRRTWGRYVGTGGGGGGAAAAAADANLHQVVPRISVLIVNCAAISKHASRNCIRLGNACVWPPCRPFVRRRAHIDTDDAVGAGGGCSFVVAAEQVPHVADNHDARAGGDVVEATALDGEGQVGGEVGAACEGGGEGGEGGEGEGGARGDGGGDKEEQNHGWNAPWHIGHRNFENDLPQPPPPPPHFEAIAAHKQPRLRATRRARAQTHTQPIWFFVCDV